MKCLRCGYCCKKYAVAIIKDPNGEFCEDNIIMHTGDRPCIHLRGEKSGEYSCAVHDKPGYETTPCFAHGQFEWKDSPCRIGEYILKNGLKI